MKRSFLKVHGSGNTFYLYATNDEQELDWPELTKWLCNKENENGADGLLLVLPSKHAHAKMRVINADGSEASMCGNGLRCVARYVCEQQGIEEATIETMKATLHVQKAAPIFQELPTYAVEISPVSFELSSLPMNYGQETQLVHQVIEQFSPTIHFTAVSVPNPHLIGIVNSYYIKSRSHQFLLSQYLNHENDYCPDGCNVSYVHPMAEDTIYVRTYERGVGFTNACGTAMTASALVAKMNHLVNGELITVFNPGGFVRCEVKEQDGQYVLKLIGNATVIGSYNLTVDGGYALSDFVETDENVQYEECVHYVAEQTKFLTC